MAVTPSGELGRIRAQGAFHETSVNQLRSSLGQGNYWALNGLTDVVPYPGTSVFTGAAIDAATGPAPIAGPQDSQAAGNTQTGDDGCVIEIYDSVGFAHTVTFPTNSIANNKHILTFNGTKGSNVQMQAINGIWYPTVLVGVTVS